MLHQPCTPAAQGGEMQIDGCGGHRALEVLPIGSKGNRRTIRRGDRPVFLLGIPREKMLDNLAIPPDRAGRMIGKHEIREPCHG